MRELDLSNITRGVFGKNVKIRCENFETTDNFFIGDDVILEAKKIILGNNSVIERGVTVKAIKGVMSKFVIGDESLVGHNSQILVPEFRMLDYSRMYNSVLCSGYKPVTIGYNCWIGQSAILNSAELLKIGNNVRMGNSQIWTHVASGELLEGCSFFSEKPVTIEDNVWLMGFGHTVSPGVTLAKNTIVMSGSVVSKSTIPYHTYSGIPAVDITERLNGWKTITLDEKYELLKNFIFEFTSEYSNYTSRVSLFENEDEEFINSTKSEEDNLLFIKKVNSLDKYLGSKQTIFDLNTKKYIKRRTKLEIDWMKFAVGYRARFIPFNEL